MPKSSYEEDGGLEQRANAGARSFNRSMSNIDDDNGLMAMQFSEGPQPRGTRQPQPNEGSKRKSDFAGAKSVMGTGAGRNQMDFGVRLKPMGH